MSIISIRPPRRNGPPLTAGQPFHPTLRAEALAADLEPAFAMAAHPDDVFLARRLPTDAHRARLRDLGLAMPETLLVQDAAAVLHPRRLHAPCPWAWSPSARSAMEPLLSQFAVTPPPTSPALFSKALAATVLENLASAGIDTGPLPRVVPAAAVPDAAAEFAALGWPTLVAKPLFGMAGRGQRLLTASAPVPKLPHDVLLEPWLPKVFEFSAHYDATGGELRLVGFVRLHTDARGRWLACSTGQKFLKNLAPELAAFLTRALPLFDGPIKSALQEMLAIHPHHGPLGVDTFVWRDAAGEPRLRPVVEINPRWTMGRLTLTLQKRHAPHRWLRLHTIRPEQLPSLTPPVLHDNRLHSGDIPLGDPALATSHIPRHQHRRPAVIFT